MSDLIIKKNGTDYELPMLAEHYPADRVYLDGDINKTVQDAIDGISVLVKTATGLNFTAGVTQGFSVDASRVGYTPIMASLNAANPNINVYYNQVDSGAGIVSAAGFSSIDLSNQTIGFNVLYKKN